MFCELRVIKKASDLINLLSKGDPDEFDIVISKEHCALKNAFRQVEGSRPSLADRRPPSKQIPGHRDSALLPSTFRLLTASPIRVSEAFPAKCAGARGLPESNHAAPAACSRDTSDSRPGLRTRNSLNFAGLGGGCVADPRVGA